MSKLQANEERVEKQFEAQTAKEGRINEELRDALAESEPEVGPSWEEQEEERRRWNDNDSDEGMGSVGDGPTGEELDRRCRELDERERRIRADEEGGYKARYLEMVSKDEEAKRGQKVRDDHEQEAKRLRISQESSS